MNIKRALVNFLGYGGMLGISAGTIAIKDHLLLASVGAVVSAIWLKQSLDDTRGE